MEQGQQLLDIMNEVSARLDHGPSFTPTRSVRILDEMQAFMLLDPLLADLNKQYVDAKGARLQAEKEYGRGDGMTDMAMMLEDSAWCAMQTRYMEVRANRRLMSQAHNLMDESRREEEERVAEEKTRNALKLIDQMQMMLRIREMSEAQEKRARSRADWWLFLMLMVNDKNGLFRYSHPTYNFNMLAA